MDNHHALSLVAPQPDADTLRLVLNGYLVRYPINTRRLYTCHLTHWLDWCGQLGIDPLKATRAQIDMWARWLEERDVKPLKASTVACKLNTVCGFYKYATVDGYIPINPGAHVRRPKIEFVSTTNGLEADEVRATVLAAKAEGVYSHALLCLLSFSGLRIGETVALNISDIGRSNGFRTIFLAKRKGGKTNLLALSDYQSAAIDAAIGDRTEGPLLLGRDRMTRMSQGCARRTVRRLCRRVGVTRRITPHSYRHSFVTGARDAGVSTRDIMATTSHSNPNMIDYYDRNKHTLERSASHTVTAHFMGDTAA